MTVAERVSVWIRDHKGYVHCDRCIKDALGLSRPQQVQAVTSALATSNGYSRYIGTCFECGESRSVIGWRLNSN
jgi:hypothetical protein